MALAAVDDYYHLCRKEACTQEARWWSHRSKTSHYLLRLSRHRLRESVLSLLAAPKDLRSQLCLAPLFFQAGDLVTIVTGSVRHNAKKKLGVGFAVGTKSIGRGELAKALLKKARQSPNVNVHFGCRFSTMDVQRR